MKPAINLFTLTIALTCIQAIVPHQVNAELKTPDPELGIIRIKDRPEVSQSADSLSQTPIVPAPVPEEIEEELVITGTRTSRAAKTTPGTITVFDGKYLDNNYI